MVKRGLSTSASLLVLLGMAVLTLTTAASPLPILTPTPVPPEPITFPWIERHPEAADYAAYGRGVMEEMPTYDPNSDEGWQIDLRSNDLSALDLGERLDDLMYANFDDDTVWPPEDRMPPEFDYEQIMELGLNPGLGVRALHEQGITGRGVGIGVIDQVFLVDHEEYVDQVRFYEETDDLEGMDVPAQMHSPAVASIAVGRTVGVAPEADLYFIATAFGGAESFEDIDFGYLAQPIHRLLDLNDQLPDDQKIRVIFMAIGWGPDSIGRDEAEAAVEAAQEAGILVVSSNFDEMYPVGFHGLGRSPLADPDDFDAYVYATWGGEFAYDGTRLLLPMDSRTTASPTGTDEYVFYREGGWSWSIPYLAGIYALAAQVEPEITPDEFLTLVMETGYPAHLNPNDPDDLSGYIIDPAALIAALQEE